MEAKRRIQVRDLQSSFIMMLQCADIAGMRTGWMSRTARGQQIMPLASKTVTCYVGSQPSDHYFRSVCLFACLFVQSFSQPSSIRFGSN